MMKKKNHYFQINFNTFLNNFLIKSISHYLSQKSNKSYKKNRT